MGKLLYFNDQARLLLQAGVDELVNAVPPKRWSPRSWWHSPVP